MRVGKQEVGAPLPPARYASSLLFFFFSFRCGRCVGCDELLVLRGRARVSVPEATFLLLLFLSLFLLLV